MGDQSGQIISIRTRVDHACPVNINSFGVIMFKCLFVLSGYLSPIVDVNYHLWDVYVPEEKKGKKLHNNMEKRRKRSRGG